jgi:hypothetical protein
MGNGETTMRAKQRDANPTGILVSVDIRDWSTALEKK